MRRFLRVKKGPRTDQELLAAFRQSGRAEPLAELYDRYLELSYGLCLRYLRTPAAAEDATMEVFEALLRKVPQHEIHNFRSWLHTFVRNHCLMQLRSEGRSPLHNATDDFMQSEPAVHPEEEQPWEQRAETRAALTDCIEALKAEQRRCIRLFYLEGYRYKEVAEALQLDLGRVRSHIQNGRRNLKSCMETKLKPEVPSTKSLNN
jgi:RNA polymerase sigma-70 factor (ECF subfamily)